MSGRHDRDELVELMARYAVMADTRDWDELPQSVVCDEFVGDFSSLGTPVKTFSRDAWCRQSERAFAGRVAGWSSASTTTSPCGRREAGD